jgi:hypothetical protein
MFFTLTDDHLAVQDAAKAFSDAEMKPHAAHWDETKHFPRDVLQKAAELGFASIYIREDVGGSAMTRLDAAVIFEQLARGCPSTAAFLSIHNMVSWMIDTFGSEAQRQHWLPRMTRMDVIGSYCLTEPGSGSDAASLRTSAKRDGDTWVLNGSKAFISGSGASDVYVVMARTGGDGPKGISAFIVDAKTPGVSSGANEKKLGWNSQPTCQLMFDDVRLPADALLGVEGDGFKYAMKGLDGGRINIAACSLGGAGEALDVALDYTATRKQFGKALSDFQATQFRLADMATHLDASRLMVYRAAAALDGGSADATKFCAMAKRFATDTCWQIVDEALQLHGGYGYLKDYPIERLLRDLRVHRILEGTNEIMRVIIAREMLK